MNLMETHHITGLKAKKIVFVMELPEAAKSIYQLSNANKPQNREIVFIFPNVAGTYISNIY